MSNSEEKAIYDRAGGNLPVIKLQGEWKKDIAREQAQTNYSSTNQEQPKNQNNVHNPRAAYEEMFNRNATSSPKTEKPKPDINQQRIKFLSQYDKKELSQEYIHRGNTVKGVRNLLLVSPSSFL